MARMPSSAPVSVRDPLRGAWSAAVRENRRLQAANDPLAPSGYGKDRRGVGPVLDLISRGEGTDRADGYDVVYGYERYKPPGVRPITEMTLREVRDLQEEMVRRGGKRPVGKYQIVGATMDDLMTRMGLKGTERFTPLLQDQMAVELLRRRGYQKFLDGAMSAADFQTALGTEWASLRDGGPNARIKPAEIQQALDKSIAEDNALQADLDAGRQPW